MIERRHARWWHMLNSASRMAVLNGAVPWARYPFINEYPKSGGSWLSQMLSDALELPNPRKRLPMLKSSIMHGHYASQKNFRDVVLLWRDGRDVVVSQYHHMIANDHYGFPALKAEMRSKIGKVDYMDVETNLPKFIEIQHSGNGSPGFSWQDFWLAWRQSDRVLVETTYESMLEDPARELIKISAVFGADLSTEKASSIADNYSFAKQANRKPGEEDKQSFLRKGISGDWKNYFNAEARQIFDHYCGDALIGLNYESDRRWVAASDESANLQL